MADTNRTVFPRRSVRKVSQNSYIQHRNAKNELREKVRQTLNHLCNKKVSEILRKPEHERTCADKALVKRNPDLVKTSQKNAKRLKENKDRLLEIEDDPSVLHEKCQNLAELIKSSEHVVVYTGAGISTAASIPDYRGPNGVWTLLKKGQELCPQDLSDAEPTYTHMSLTKLFRAKKVKHVVSQNCDGLHIRSGFPRYSLSELHGNMYIEMCYNCAPHREYVRLFDVTERTCVRRHATSRRCRACGVNLTDTIVHFGEKGKIRSPYRWKEAVRAAKRADLILCLGSSLKVLKKYTCLWCMDQKPHLRPKLAIVNLQWTPKDDVASLKINGRCDSVMRMVMKLLDYDVPEYQRDLDPIFRICTPLRASELKTTSKKILIPPAQLAKPPRQSKKTKNTEIATLQGAYDKEETKCEPKHAEGMCSSLNARDKLSASHCEQVQIEANTTVTSSLWNTNLELYNSPEMNNVTQQPFSTSTQPLCSPESLVSEIDVSAESTNSSSTSGSCVKPESNCCKELSSATFPSKDHPLNLSSVMCPGTISGVSNPLAVQESDIVLPLKSSSATCSAKPLETIIKPWLVGEATVTEYGISNSTTSTVGSIPLVESSPTLVVVNLDGPTVSTSFIPASNQGFAQTADSLFLDYSRDKLKCPPQPSLCSFSQPEDSKKESSPFPVFLTCVSDLGQTLTIPVTTLSQPAALPASVCKSQATAQQDKSVTLDHSYFHDTATASRCKTSVSTSQIKNNLSSPDHLSTHVPSYISSAVSNTLFEASDDITYDNKTAKHKLDGHHFIEKSPSTNVPSLHPSSSCLIQRDGSQSSFEGNQRTQSSETGTKSTSLFPEPFVSDTAPMCVLNMDEMETTYILPDDQLQCMSTSDSNTTAANFDDITLELQLPISCEILTMDMLSANPASWDLSGDADAQLVSQKSTLLPGETNWQPMHVGNILQSMTPNEPLVNSILSSSLEPVVCNLAIDNNPHSDGIESKLTTKTPDSRKVLFINLDDGMSSTPKEIGQPKTCQELSKVIKHTKIASPCASVKKTGTAWAEERMPLSPRSSEVAYASQVTASGYFQSLGPGDSGAVSGKPLSTYCDSRKSVLGVKAGKAGKQQHKKKNELHKKIRSKETMNKGKGEDKQVGLENICKNVCKSKCAPSSVPGWFGKGLGLKKKRK